MSATTSPQRDASRAGAASDEEYEARVQRRIAELLAKLPPLSDAKIRRIRQALTPSSSGSATSTRSGSSR